MLSMEEFTEPLEGSRKVHEGAVTRADLLFLEVLPIHPCVHNYFVLFSLSNVLQVGSCHVSCSSCFAEVDDTLSSAADHDLHYVPKVLASPKQ